MRAIQTHDLRSPPASATESLWIYNGLDCCVTAEVFDAISSQLDNQTRSTYEFSKSLQGPVLEMKLRGVLVDQAERSKVVADFARRLGLLEANFNRIVEEGIGIGPMNWRSNDQLKNLFYRVMGIPEIKKKGKVTVDRDALEKLETYFYAGPIIHHILAMRDLAKKIGVLKTDIDGDGRVRTSYNIGGTTTGRFSSNLSDFGTGTNLQNIEEQLRRIFISDPGYKFAYIDLEQAESRLVGAIEWNLFKDGRYLDACESGDLHTTVCKLAWQSLPWVGNLADDKMVAEQPFYRQHSYRHMAKVLGHGTNYNGQPFTMAKHTKLDASIIKEFQTSYFAAFPAHKEWHEAVAQELLNEGHLTTLTGRRRWFFGRRNDAATVREAIAYNPQGSVGDILNQGMLKVWQLAKCQLLLQVHDAILVQYPEEQEDELLPQLLAAIQVPVELAYGRQLMIPSEAKVGWNWSNYCCGDISKCKNCPAKGRANPDGLAKYKGGDTRRRTFNPQTSLLDRVVL